MCDMLKELRQRSQKRKKLLAQTVSYSVSSTIARCFFKTCGLLDLCEIYTTSSCSLMYEWRYTFTPPYAFISHVSTVFFLALQFGFIYFNLFPYILFRYIPWKWKKSRRICIFKQLIIGITNR